MDTRSFFGSRAEEYEAVSKWAVDRRLADATAECLRDRGGDVALDLGSGTGALLSEIRNFRHVMAIDLAAEMLARIRPGAIAKVVGDAHSIPLRRGSVDL